MGLTKPRAAQIYDIDYKQATRVITVTDINLTGGAPSQVDGVNLAKNDRILVTGNDPASENGIYLVQTLGSGSNGTWVRTLDTDVSGELLAGTIVMVTEGLIYHDTQWKLTTDDPIVIGTTPLTFEQNSAFAFGNVYANGTAVLATSVGDVLTLTAGNNIQITGNNATKTVNIAVTGISLTSVSNGTSNVNVTSSGGNVTVGIGGTDGIATFATTGEYVTGVVSASGNITGANLIGGGLTVNNDALISGNLSVVGNATLSGNILGDRIINGNTSIEIQTASGNANISVGGTTNVAVFSTSGEYVTGVISATGNVTGGNILTLGQVSATGNVTGNYIVANGSQLTGVNTFATIAVAAQSNILANSIATTLTFEAGNGMSITTSDLTKTVTISYTGGSGGGSIFASGGDMGLVTEAVTASEDLGLVDDLVTISYNLGQLGVDGVVSNSDIIANTITGDKINSSTYISITGNLTAANLALTSSATDARGWWYAGSSKSTSTQDSTPNGVWVEPVFGYNMYVLGTATDTIYQYTLSTPYSPSSATYASKSASVASQDSSPQGMYLLATGQDVYIAGAATSTIYQYAITPGDISTLTYGNKFLSVSGEDSAPSAVTLKPDGANCYIIGATTKSVFQYAMLEAGNLLTASYSAKSFDFTSQDATPVGLSFSANGVNMYMLGATNKKIYQYVLSDPWNVTSSTYYGSFYVGDQETVPTSFSLNLTNEYGYLTGSAPASVFQYGLGNGTIATSNSMYHTSALQLNGSIYTAGNVTGNYILGNGALLTGVSTTSSNINNGTSNVTVVSSGGNVTVGVAGTSNVVVLASTGQYVTGLVSASGNITGNYFIGNGSALTGITASGGSPAALNITLQQNFGGF